MTDLGPRLPAPSAVTPQLSLSIAHPAMTRKAQIEADRLASLYYYPAAPSLHEGYRQLLGAMSWIGKSLEEGTSGKDRLEAWHKLSSAFWSYQHILWDDLKAHGYWAQRNEEYRKTSAAIIAKRKPVNETLTLEELGL